MELDSNPDRPLALVTGASSGIGYELAKQFAQHGFDLVIVSENAGIVEAAQVCKNLGANVESFIIDLAEYDGVDRLIDKLSDINRPLEALAINSGIGLAERLALEASNIDIEEELKIIHLNVVSCVHLTKHVLIEMTKRKKGRILFSSSNVVSAPSPLQAVYGASQAFIHSFSDSIRNEIRETGVTVTALSDTNSVTPIKESPTEVAQQGFIAMMNGESHVVVGTIKNKINVHLNKIKTEEGKAASVRDYSEPTKLKH